MIRKFVPLFFSAAVLSVVFLVFWQRGPAPRLTEISHQMEVDMSIQDFSLIQGEEGEAGWELVADNAGYLKDKDVFVLDAPVITCYTRNDADTLEIRASQGMVMQQTGTVHLWPDVKAFHGEITVHADRATYIGGERHILLEENVLFSGQGIAVISPEARIDLDQDRLEASGGVRTRLSVVK